ncbi:Uncharacterized protein Adt_28466 [Abeliophyllum distichum]|uniref:Uncharacterized protein n=1 Tax=Abeliophyllum distichum TaxID=126358 RepID=A0ABD1RX17_9LAMI
MEDYLDVQELIDQENQQQRNENWNGLGQILFNDGSTVNILFGSAFDQMDIDYEPTAISEPLFSFTGDSLVLRERIIIAVDFREPPCHLKKFMEFLVVDTRSTYHGVFGTLALKNLQAVTSIYHLVMKFPTPGGVAKVRRNQTKARAYYINALQKIVRRDDAPLAVMTIQMELMNIDLKKAEEDMILDEGLDLQIIGPDSLASLEEKLETFPVNSSDPSKMLQLGQKLDEGMKEKLKQILRENVDVFVWKHSDMVGIIPSVAYHSLNVDPKIQKRIPLSTKNYGTLKEKFDKLLANGFIRETIYPQWVSNHVLILQKLDTSGRLIKWFIELIQFDIFYKPRLSIKGQALADFMAKFAHIPEGLLEAKPHKLLLIFFSNHSLKVAIRRGKSTLSSEHSILGQFLCSFFNPFLALGLSQILYRRLKLCLQIGLSNH